MRDVLLVLHIASAGTWLGANVLQAVVPPLAARQGTAAVAGWYRVAGQLSRRLYMPISIVLLVTGSIMVLLDDSFTFGSLFVTVGFAMIAIGAIFGIFVFAPGSERVAAAIESGDRAKVRGAVSRITRFGTLDTLLLLLTITAMVIRWN